MLPRSAVKNAPSAANPFEQQLAGGAMTLGSALSDDDRSSSKALSDYARSQAGSTMNSSVEGWLSQFGTVRSQISLNDNLSLSDSSLDMLVPLYDSKKQMLFTQFGARHKDDRNTLNVGVGGRIFPTDDWMLGVNTFFDNDITGHNYRIGVGGEAWTDYLKLSANSYQRLNGWHQSRDFDDYDERPANGYDLRVNGFLPVYPQLGGKLMYEQYFGQEVALFGKDDRQKDPYAVTVGVNYTPVPMVTFGADQRLGKSGKDDFSLNMEINYQLDKSWADNSSPEAVDALRKLSRSRYDLVERNNNIILEYRKQQVIKMQLASSRITGESGTVHSLAARVTTKHGLKEIAWNGPSFNTMGGEINALDTTHFAVKLPQYQVAQQAQAANKASGKTKGNDASRILNTYVLTAVAEDTKGNKSRPTQLTVEVLPPEVHFAGPASIVNDNAAPDGESAVQVIFGVVNGNKQPLAEQPVTFTITYADGQTGTQSVISDSKGKATLMLTSTVSGPVTIVARLESGETSIAHVTFSAAQPDAAHSSLTAAPETIIANGSASSVLTLTLHDAADRPLSGLTGVRFAIAGVSDAIVTAVNESSPGVYTANLSGHSTGTANITTAMNGSSIAGIGSHVELTGDSATATIKEGDMAVSVASAVADGHSAASVVVKVTDASGNPITGQTVSFSASKGATIAASATSDANGSITLPITSLTAGVVDVTATLNGKSQTVQVTFLADQNSAQLATGALTVLTNDVRANGLDQNRVQAVVTDAGNNPVVGASVSFTASNGATLPATGVTDGSGVVVVPVQSNKAGAAEVKATINEHSQQVTVNFTADKSTSTGKLVVTKNDAPANGTETNAISLTVVDAHDNPLSGIPVTFSADNGATITTTATTNASGIATATLSSTKAGVSNVTAKTDHFSVSIDTLFNADSSSAQIAEGDLKVLTDGMVADGHASNVVEVLVTDSHANPVPNQNVSLSASNEATMKISGSTDKNGLLTMRLQNTKAGITVVEAWTNAGTHRSVNTTFIGNKATARGTLSVEANNAVADGTAMNKLKLTFIDANNNPLEGINATFSATNSVIITPSGTTNSAGELLVMATSKTAGLSQVSAMGGNGNFSANITFTADSKTAQITAGNLTVTSDNAIANGSAHNEVQAKVTDASGNPVANQAVTFTADNGAIIAGSGATNANGIVRMPLSNTKAGITPVTASVGSGSQSVETTFIADRATATLKLQSVRVTTESAVANGADTNTVTALVTDKYDNPVDKIDVAFTVDIGTIIGSPAPTNTQGVATVEISSLKAGLSKVTGTVNGSSRSAQATFTADSGSAQLATGSLTVVANNAATDGKAQNSVRAIVTDANGNPLDKQTVTFSASNGAQIAGNGISNAQGVITLPLTSSTVGDSLVTATINGSQQQVTVTFVADSDSAHIADGDLTVLKDNAVANDTDTNSVQAVVTDANGNPLDNIVVNFSAGNHATLTASGKTDAQGKVSVTLHSAIAGVSIVTAEVAGGSQQVSTTFIADSGTATISSGDLTVTQDGAIANGTAANRVQVKVTDARGNPVDKQSVTFTADSGATIDASGTTAADGLVSLPVVSTKSGVSQVTATVNGHSQTVPVNFVADSSTAIVAAGNLTVVSNDALADGSSTNSVNVVVTDANQNRVSDVVVRFSADNGATIAETATTGDNGEVLVTLTNVTAGTTAVTAQANGNGQSVTVNFTADSNTARIATGDMTITTNNVLADGTKTNVVRVQVSDAKGNAVEKAVVNFTADNSAIIAATGETDENGVISQPLSSKKAGLSNVTATINGSSQSVPVTFVADASTATIIDGAMTVIADNAITDGNATNSVQVTVTDANGNPLADQVVTFTADNGATLGDTSTTDANGQITMTLSSTTAGGGVSNVTASINDSSRTVQVTFIGSLTIQSLSFDNGSVNQPAGKATGEFTAIIVDANNGNPLADRSVEFAINKGAKFTETDAAKQIVVSDVQGRAKIKGVYLPNVSYSTTSFKYDITVKSGNESKMLTVQATGLVMYPNRDNSGAGGSGKNTNEIYMQYIGDDGQLQSDIPIYAAVSGSSASWKYGSNNSSDPATTNNGGTVSIVVSSSVAGGVTVSGSLSASLSNPVSIISTFK
ncbi:Ig-like domain-containing protein [Scandinavium sp. H11S7]|uniref:Ig-like domain-containing protein n=1 Tax=Scandinavium hiltneri TaxID=2926519 RepID=UPI0021657D18|nr:Ig-like domain-containing protein [Scandinavium hiltneri]MCS2159363.1 Ig-like domain-containing protein [Scandinavium hiltneri]